MNIPFNTRNGLNRFAEVVTFAVMVGMVATTAAMAYTPDIGAPAAVPERLPTVVVTNTGVYTLQQLPAVVVTARRASR